MKQKLGKKEKKAKGAHFYSNPMSMNLDDEVGSNEKRMKRAARFRETGMEKRRKPLNLLSSLNDKLMNDDFEVSFRIMLVNISILINRRATWTGRETTWWEPAPR